MYDWIKTTGSRWVAGWTGCPATLIQRVLGQVMGFGKELQSRPRVPCHGPEAVGALVAVTSMLTPPVQRAAAPPCLPRREDPAHQSRPNLKHSWLPVSNKVLELRKVRGAGRGGCGVWSMGASGVGQGSAGCGLWLMRAVPWGPAPSPPTSPPACTSATPTSVTLRPPPPAHTPAVQPPADGVPRGAALLGPRHRDVVRQDVLAGPPAGEAVPHQAPRAAVLHHDAAAGPHRGLPQVRGFAAWGHAPGCLPGVCAAGCRRVRWQGCWTSLGTTSSEEGAG